MKLWLRFSAFVLLGTLAGCSIHKYRPAPVSTVTMLATFESRTLASGDLREFLRTHAHQDVSEWPWRIWGPEQLTLAAYFYSPELDQARASLANAQAGVITAGARPNPSIGLGAGSESSSDSPYLWNIDFTLPVETAGKRGYRIQEAQQLTEASKLTLAETAWQVRMKVRSALLEYLNAKKQVAALTAEQHARLAQLKMLRRRLQVGEIDQREVTQAEFDLSNLRLALREEEGTVKSNLDVLAAAIGIPVTDLEQHQLVWQDYDHPPRIVSETIRKDAAINRLDLRESVAEYQASEAALRLQIAKQYPDLQLGPSVAHQEGYNDLSLGVSLELPIFNRNQGPIAEAEAARKVAASKLRVLQNEAIAQANYALDSYDTALRQLKETESELLNYQTRSEQQAKRAVEMGEEDGLALALLQIQGSIAERAHLDALHAVQAALGGIENAIQKPLEGRTTPVNLQHEPIRHETSRRIP